MLDAEQELLQLGQGALPVLASLFSGEARNRFGVAYRDLGLPLRCGLEVAIRLGPVVKPLEARLRNELTGHCGFVAAQALGAMGSLEEDTIVALAENLDGGLDLSAESAAAFIRCGAAEHEAVRAVCRKSAKAAETMQRFEKFLLQTSKAQK